MCNGEHEESLCSMRIYESEVYEVILTHLEPECSYLGTKFFKYQYIFSGFTRISETWKLVFGISDAYSFSKRRNNLFESGTLVDIRQIFKNYILYVI